MTPVWEDSHGALWQGDVRACLAAMEPESVQCVVTSPPYWGLRAYGTDPQIWGGSPACDHTLSETPGLPPMTGGNGTASATQVTSAGSQFGNAWAESHWYREGGGGASSSAEAFSKPGPENAARLKAARWHTDATCTRCGAWRGELGSEPRHDCAGWATSAPCGACFICHLVEVFTAVKRVLRPDGVCLVNLGDSYAGSGKGWGGGSISEKGNQFEHCGAINSGKVPPGLKAKDMVGIPWRFALAMQAAGWWLRSEITWCKTSTMPESVTDRPTNATEKIFLFAKSERYFWDSEAVKQPNTLATIDRMSGPARRYADHKPLGTIPPGHPGEAHPEYHHNGLTVNGGGTNGANLRNYWVLGPEPFADAHFAVFPSEIPRRAVLAGTSERGACAACGAPHRRVTAPPTGDRVGQGAWANHAEDAIKGNAKFDGGDHWKTYQRGETTGWTPTCTCECPDTRPCTVLDPFAGSSTTLLVARQLGRIGWGIELQPDYVTMSLKRLRQHVLF